jgi:hypothetical protein
MWCFLVAQLEDFAAMRLRRHVATMRRKQLL